MLWSASWSAPSNQVRRAALASVDPSTSDRALHFLARAFLGGGFSRVGTPRVRVGGYARVDTSHYATRKDLLPGKSSYPSELELNVCRSRISPIGAYD